MLRHSPLLRPRTDSTRLPQMLIPRRVSAATVSLNRRSIPRPTGVVEITYLRSGLPGDSGRADIGRSSGSM